MKNLNSAQTLEHELKTAKDLSITVKNIKYFSGHDGMQGINADVYHKGKKFAKAYDDARGGEMDIRPISYEIDILDLFKRIERELKDLPEYNHVFSVDRNNAKIGGKPITMKTRVDLAAIVDAIATQKESEKEAKKGIVYLKDGEEYIVSWKGLNLPKIVSKSKGLTVVQIRYDSLIKEGRTVLNLPYLESIGVKV